MWRIESSDTNLKFQNLKNAKDWCRVQWPKCSFDGNGEDFNGKPLEIFVFSEDEEELAKIIPI